MTESYQIFPIGTIHKDGDTPRIEIRDAYLDAMDGLAGFSHITVLYWFHQNDTPEKRGILKVRPRKDPTNPLTGVFATHSPCRPNLVAITHCQITAIDGNIIHIDEIDAYDQTPVIDIKPYIPMDKMTEENVRVPDWVNKRRGRA
jgi:tRNA-Thr(GGU) m(6)t(6)A37 methyltransferase TsaA